MTKIIKVDMLKWWWDSWHEKINRMSLRTLKDIDTMLTFEGETLDELHAYIKEVIKNAE